MAIIARGQITVNSVADSLSGANLLLDTQAPYLSNSSIWNFCSGASILGSVGNFTTVKVTSNWGRCWQRIDLQPNKTYTFSCWLKRDTATEQSTTLLSWFQGNNGGSAVGLTLINSTFGKSLSGMTAPTEFTRCYWTFKTSSSYSDTSVPRLEPYCSNYTVASPCLVVYGYQLEEGEVMSDWKPNPADYNRIAEFRYAKNTSATASPAITQSSTTPAGWSLTQPTLSTGEYLWESFAIKTNAGALLQNWSTPVRKSGSDGQYTAYNFAKNTSTTTAPTTGWAASPPALASGEYLWMRSGTVVPPATTPATWNAAVRISGEKGDKGDKGDTGATGATGSAGTAGPGIVYRGMHSSAVVYYNNSLRRDIVKYGTTFYVYKGANGVSGAWNAANWDAFGAEFTSVATDLLLASLAYIENLGVKNLKTATAGQRVEITQANNALAFYDNSQSYPVVEIKTTSDSIYMGQGSGILVKHPNSNISINNGILQNSSEGSGVSVPILAWSQPETIAQNCILQSYNNSNTGKYKTGLYVDVSGTQSTASGADKLTAIFTTAGMFMQGGASAFRSNNVLCGVTAAGRVSATGSLLNSWVITYMGGYMTSSRTAAGKYRITFSNTSYLYGAYDYHVFLLPDGPISGGANGAYGCTIARTSSYFDVWMADDASANDCAFTFIVFLISKFF